MTRPRKALISPDTPYLPHHLALRTHSTSWGRLYPKHFVGQALPKALRGAGSTQSTSWGRLCVALSCAGLIIIPAKVTNIDGNGSWTGFVCCHRYSPSMFAPTP